MCAVFVRSIPDESMVHAASAEEEWDGRPLYGLDRDYAVETKPYILSNESNREKTLEALSRTVPSEGAFHIGFSCWQNYDFMVARNSCGGLITDISNQARDFHEITAKMVLDAPNRTEFVKNMIAFLRENPSFLRETEKEVLADIEAELSRPGSWLSTDAGFEKIQILYKGNRIVHIRMDITDVDAFDQIAKWMRASKLHCDSLYISNIPDWLNDSEDSRRKMGRLKMAMNRVINPETYIIHASELFREYSGMPQRVYQGYPYDPLKSMTSGSLS